MQGLHDDSLVYADGIDLIVAGTADLKYAGDQLCSSAIRVKDRTLTLNGDITATQDLMDAAMRADGGIIITGGTVTVGCHGSGFETEGDFIVTDGITRVEASGGIAALTHAQHVRLGSHVMIVD